MTADEGKAAALTENLRERLQRAVGMPPPDTASIGVLVDAGELKVALEVLCTQIFEYDLELESDERDGLRALGRELGVPVSWLLGDPWADQTPG